MKKIISLLMIFVFILSICFSINSYAAALDTLSIDIDKTSVLPGENVTLVMNFGKSLGAYTFKISYDKNIFSFVAADGGTANDTGDKVIVTFYDTTGGTNPRNNMSITFKAKDDITTSNPTELTVVAEGLSNSDASVIYDDITTPIVKNITVEPRYEDYAIKLEYIGDIIKGKEKEITLSFSSPLGRYYEHARLIAEAIAPDNATIKLTGLNKTDNVEQDIIQNGWGDSQGYKIGGKNAGQTLNLKGLFSDSGNYKVTFKLIDRDNSDTVITEKQVAFVVLDSEKVEGNIAPTQEISPAPSNPSPNVAPSNPESSAPVQNTKTEAKPKVLPKTGKNIYVPAIIMSFGFVGIILILNKENYK